MMRRTTVVGVVAGCCAGVSAQGDWTHYGRDARRSCVTNAAVPPLNVVRWTLSQYLGQPVTFPNPGGVVAAGGMVYAVGKLGSADAAFAVYGTSGQVRWAVPVPAPIFDSFSTPAVDVANGTVLVAAGNTVRALRVGDGSVAWAATLMADVVNASPCVTTDRGPADRALITDFDFSGSGRLYCINIDPFAAGTNPHVPGEILWSIPIGSASGNSPSYVNGRVYLTCAEQSPGDPGAVLCYQLTDSPPASTVWSIPNPAGQGYYGGVCVTPTPLGTMVHAASYGFVGGQLAGDLIAIDGDTGTVAWHSPCNRTDSTPVVLPDGRVVVSGGLEGFGSVPSLELFSAGGTLLWDTALATWSDSNNNQQIDPGEYLRVGGWTHQPAVISIGAQDFAIAGDPGTTAPDRLLTLRLGESPAGPSFVGPVYTGAGATPAVALAEFVSGAFTTGPAGLVALGAPACYANCDGSATPPALNVQDFSCFINRFAGGEPYANCDGSTTPPVLNVQDFACFLNRFAAGCS